MKHFNFLLKRKTFSASTLISRFGVDKLKCAIKPIGNVVDFCAFEYRQAIRIDHYLDAGGILKSADVATVLANDERGAQHPHKFAAHELLQPPGTVFFGDLVVFVRQQGEVEVLLLDEPFNGLDPSTQIRLINMLNEIKRTDSTTLMIFTENKLWWWQTLLLKNLEGLCHKE